MALSQKRRTALRSSRAEAQQQAGAADRPAQEVSEDSLRKESLSCTAASMRCPRERRPSRRQRRSAPGGRPASSTPTMSAALSCMLIPVPCCMLWWALPCIPTLLGRCG